MKSTTNYQKEMEKIVKAHSDNNQVPTLLLHSCCAPCSSYVLEYLSQYFSVTVYYYNPNIDTATEYEARMAEQKRLTKQMETLHPITFLGEPYNPAVFYEAVKGLEKEPESGARCTVCYRLRLEQCAKIASQKGFDYFTTTLSISPLKDAARLNEIGTGLAAACGVAYLTSDFKKKNGYLRSVELSQAYGLYRQAYCGCIFSKK